MPANTTTGSSFIAAEDSRPPVYDFDDLAVLDLSINIIATGEEADLSARAVADLVRRYRPELGAYRGGAELPHPGGSTDYVLWFWLPVCDTPPREDKSECIG